MSAGGQLREFGNWRLLNCWTVSSTLADRGITLVSLLLIKIDSAICLMLIE